ncbi:thiamine ABC transporter substrate-binding protein [Streptomyces sp. TRM 70361]|uniref:thiamine ABC transporter substrate-binding protein n=1 Tax=Streptomyces sp. TRM 70361 TaxID=3116553 RepID=UPI002E7BF6BC|nr:thiamine ABC transporter substrate-binding protein [Streptomyces sp. TRM 70361]MEE1941830.1 thiamine ABC transporter substrate-binding protein [Streptomyces sp. TRM 70361]
MVTTFRRALGAAVLGTLTAALAACGGSGGGDGDGTKDTTVTLVSHDSFAASDEVLEEFTERTGHKVEVLRGGDAGSALNQAVLSKDNPQGDVFFGVDNTLLSRALDNDLFTPYEAQGLERIPAEYRLDGEKHRVTPVDTGDVCVNYDRAWFAERDIEPPETLDDLAEPRYKGLLVTENAASSSPGLGFLLATVAEYGDEWDEYWKKLDANGVEVVDGWEQAYYDRFSGSAGGEGGGDRPLVVSYASSPPAEVLDADPAPERAPTGVAAGTCFRQIEFAGLLKGADNPEGGRALLDFLVSETFQEDMPLQMFVNPVREGTELPEVFTKYGERIEEPYTMAPERIAENREAWIDTWTSLVVR